MSRDEGAKLYWHSNAFRVAFSLWNNLYIHLKGKTDSFINPCEKTTASIYFIYVFTETYQYIDVPNLVLWSYSVLFIDYLKLRIVFRPCLVIPRSRKWLGQRWLIAGSRCPTVNNVRHWRMIGEQFVKQRLNSDPTVSRPESYSNTL